MTTILDLGLYVVNSAFPTSYLRYALNTPFKGPQSLSERRTVLQGLDILQGLERSVYWPLSRFLLIQHLKTIDRYLDAAKARHKLPSDYALAKKLKVGASHISNYRSGRSHPDDAMAVHLARLLDIGPLEIIAAAHYHRASKLGDSEGMRLWTQVYKDAVGRK